MRLTFAITLAAAIILLTVVMAAAPEKPVEPTDVGEDPSVWYSDALYKKMGKPRPGDWLARFKEPGQTFEQYVSSRPTRPTTQRTTIVLLPLGDLTEEQKRMLDDLREFTHLYFGVPVRVEETVPLPEHHFRKRSWGGREWMQYQTGYILSEILKPRLPRDAICLLGVTMEDLYPDETWNYVFGQASLRERAGVYSLVRYFPEFWGEKRTEESQTKAFGRACKTLAHETGHMFGLLHCTAYECLMNGSNSLAESDRRPTALCPVCLKKLRWSLGFDIPERYKKLAEFYKKHNLKSEGEFIQKRLEEVEPTNDRTDESNSVQETAK